MQLDCFDAAQFTGEDKARAGMYVAERKREGLKTEMPTVADWLRSLQTKVTVEELNASNRARVAQLFNKTNQMNLTTRRLPENELAQWASQEKRKLLAFRVADRFGDSGLTGILSLEFSDQTATIIDFILSCRVMGRQVEETMLAVAVEYCRWAGARKLRAQYVPTAKNKPCREFWMRSGFDKDEAGEVFTFDVAQDYPRPASVELASGELSFALAVATAAGSAEAGVETQVREVEPISAP